MLRLVFRNYSTLFLVVAVLVVPLHLAHSFVYKEVAQVQELHPYIENQPRGRQVQGVGRAGLAEARRRYLWVLIAELLLLPVFAGATRRVLVVDAAGGLPGVIDAYRNLLSKRGTRSGGSPSPASRFGAVASGILLALVISWLVRGIGLLMAEMGPDAARWLIAGLTGALAFAAGAPFALVPAMAPTPAVAPEPA